MIILNEANELVVKLMDMEKSDRLSQENIKIIVREYVDEQNREEGVKC